MEEQTNTLKNWLHSGSINIFGLPFCGKDTQGQRMAELLDGVMISSGDVLRHDHGNSQVKELMAAGDIIPSDLFEEIVVPYLSRPELEGHPLVLSEVGRMDGEQYVIERACEASGHTQKAVILLAMSDDEVWKRFEAAQASGDRGERDDDNRSVLQHRLDSYHEKVTPVLDYYRNKDMLIEIDGTQPRDDVTDDIIKQLINRAHASS